MIEVESQPILELHFCRLSDSERRGIVPVAVFSLKSFLIGDALIVFVVRCCFEPSDIECPPFAYMASRGSLTATRRAIGTQSPMARFRGASASRGIVYRVHLRHEEHRVTSVPLTLAWPFFWMRMGFHQHHDVFSSRFVLVGYQQQRNAGY
jgi:hypothetical protein